MKSGTDNPISTSIITATRVSSIRVNADLFNVIAPGFVETDMTSGLSDALREKYIGQIPLARFCSPEEVASAVHFIASPEAGYITGAVIPVDGGLGMGH